MVEWRITSEDIVLQTPWFEVSLAAVELPGGKSLEHYVLRRPSVVLTAMLDDQDRVLLVGVPLHHGHQGWDCRRGWRAETMGASAAAAREALAETGWEPLDPRPLVQLDELPGLAAAAQHVFWTDPARHRGAPGWETERLDWIPLRQVPALIAAGQVRASSTAAALLHLHAALPRDR